jgi:integrase
MTVYRRGQIYHYEFEYKGQRYRGTTEMAEKDKAEAVEAVVRQQLREASWGIAVPDRMATPSFSAFAPHYYAYKKQQNKRADFTLSCLNVVLEFFGQAPTKPRKKAAVDRPFPGGTPYHNLRLLDLITDPDWLVKFEAWMEDRGISGARKNHLRSTVSGMYRLAVQPHWRKRTHITVNPMQGISRDRVRSRTRVLDTEELQLILTRAPAHLKVALAIAVYAPKLREGNILALRFSDHLDRHLTAITVREHKADRNRPELVVPLVAHHDTWTEILPLRWVLLEARRRNTSDAVVEFGGSPIKAIKTAMRTAVTSAGFRYGTKTPDGVTFHTVRHSMATLLATVPTLSEKLRAEIMGQTIQTAQKYTHLAAAHQVSGHRSIAALLGDARLLSPPGAPGDDRRADGTVDTASEPPKASRNRHGVREVARRRRTARTLKA